MFLCAVASILRDFRAAPRRPAGLSAILLGVLLLTNPSEAPAQLQPPDPGPGQPVALELVLAVDTSSSVSPEEFDLQMRGFAEAFRNPTVIAAIAATGASGVAVSMIQWSDNLRQQVAVDWALLDNEDAVLDFAGLIDGTPRFLDGGGTAIGGAIAFSLSEIDRNGFEGSRKVIDISGDGRANQGSQPETLRDLAVLQGVTVNGLAILNEDSYVDSYYRNSVIGGPGAFVMTANDYESFAAAIMEKLLKEIGGVPIAAAPPAAVQEPSEPVSHVVPQVAGTRESGPGAGVGEGRPEPR
jgi:Protein of unknown function (DUF1194)